MGLLDYNWAARGEFPGFGTRPGGVPLGKDTLPALTVVEETVADALVLHAQGRLTIEDVRGLKRSLEQGWRMSITRIVLDLSECPYVDSSGIALLVDTLNRSRKEKKTFFLAGPSPQVQSVLQLTKLDKIFKIFPSVLTALAG